MEAWSTATFTSRLKRIFQSNLGVLTVTTGIWNVASNLADPYFSLYILALGGSYFDIGLTSALGNLLMIIPLVFAGSLTDVIGRKRLVVGFGYALAITYIIYAQAPNWQFLLLGQAATSLIHGFRSPAFSSIVADSTRSENRAFSIALWQRIPQAIRLASPLLGGYLIDQLGIIPAMQSFYVFTFIACMIAHILRHKYLQETLSTLQHNVVEGWKKTIREIKTLPNHVSRQALYLIGINALLHLASMTANAYWVVYATGEVGGLTASEWGMATLFHDFVLIAFSIIFGFAADKFGKFRFVFISFILTPIAIVIFPTRQGFLEILIVRGVFGLLTSLRTAAFSALFIDYSPRMFRGRLNAFQRLASRPMVIVGSLLGGLLYQQVSAPAPFVVYAVVLGITGIIFYLLMKDS